MKIRSLFNFINDERLLDDDISLEAIATDASFYKLRPKLIIDVNNEEEIAKIFSICKKNLIPITLRAAGTSLSGQSQGDGVILRLSNSFKDVKILNSGNQIALGVGVVGSHANRHLKLFNKKIGPDPASINSCMIGGIVANNASGMCCGVDQNTYKTLASMRILLPSQKNEFEFLDTGNPNSKDNFAYHNKSILDELSKIRNEIIADSALKELIISKYKIKNTMGYSLNSFLDFEDPIDILQHLLIGSEGTLGFISEVTYHTVTDHKIKSCALVFFKTLASACEAAYQLRSLPIAAAELMDRTSLRSIENKEGMPEILKTLEENVCALLIETRANSNDELMSNLELIKNKLLQLDLYTEPMFSRDQATIDSWWKIRKGLFPAVGKGRKPGTTVIIEDIAFKHEELAKGASELVTILKNNNYHQAILFGHALDGNLHFCFAQDFTTPDAISQYEKMMSEVADLVAVKYKGSLKAEHGTGRNMAPFVEKEWGEKAYSIMKRVKQILDPQGILNPGVILNENPNAHLENIKVNPPVDPLIDECIECGFCEVNCPTKEFTLTPRQRIVSFRSLNKIKDPFLKLKFEKQMNYPVESTCATDGLCSSACPVDIDTGVFIKKYRDQKNHSMISFKNTLAQTISNHFEMTLLFIRLGLKLANYIPNFLLEELKKIPKLDFINHLPNVANHQQLYNYKPISSDKIIVYYPSCIARTMGPNQHDHYQQSLPDAHLELFTKAGYKIIIPENLKHTCCGLPFESKGHKRIATEKASELEAKLMIASENGLHPIICDTSPCTSQMIKKMNHNLKIYDSIAFAAKELLSQENKFKFKKTTNPMALHLTCSTKKMGIDQPILALAHQLSSHVIIPPEIGCCGFAGDKGFQNPQMNNSALHGLSEIVHSENCTHGFSNSRTCEIGLAKNSGISYQSLIYELNDKIEVTKNKS